MRKNTKKLVSVLFALAVIIGCTCFMTVDTQAAKTHNYKCDSKKGIAWNTALRVFLTSFHEDTTVMLEDPDYYISSVKVNKPGLYAKVTSESTITNGTYSMSWAEGLENYRFHKSCNIQLYALKKGTYTVTFTVKNAKKKTVAKKKIKVYAGYEYSVLKQITYAGTDYYIYGDENNICTKKGSGKLKLVPTSDYKIKKVEIATKYDEEGQPIFKTVKNGKKITLAKKTKYTTYTFKHDYTRDDGYVSKWQQGTYRDYVKPMTIIKLTYYDKKLKITGSEYQYIFNIK